MMKNCLAWIVLLFLLKGTINAQEAIVTTLKGDIHRVIKKEPDSLLWNWKKGGVFTLNMSQGSLNNWAAGGDNFSLAINTYFNYYYYHRKDRYSWDNNIDFNLGFVQSTSKGSRKNDDRIDFLSKYGYEVDSTGKWYLTGLFNFRTQMFDGYTYSGGDIEFSSTIFAPAYVILSGGFDYKFTDKFSLFLSPLTARWVIVMDDYLSSKGKYGVDSGKHSLTQLGTFLTINYNNTIAKNITYKGRLDLFSNYLNHPENINVFISNQFSCKINKFVSVSYSLDLIYDDNIRSFGPDGKSPGLQMKSLLGIGLFAPLNVVRRKSR